MRRPKRPGGWFTGWRSVAIAAPQREATAKSRCVATAEALFVTGSNGSRESKAQEHAAAYIAGS